MDNFKYEHEKGREIGFLYYQKNLLFVWKSGKVTGFVANSIIIYMLNIRILAVGKIKEKYFTQALAEYTKRLSRFAKSDVIAVKDQATPEKASEAENMAILDIEGQRLLGKIKSRDYVVALAIEGDLISSPELALRMKNIPLRGYSTIDFVIGGSLGLSQAVKQRADEKISFGRITLPHQLARVVLSEQIYRAFMINEGSPYHK